MKDHETNSTGEEFGRCRQCGHPPPGGRWFARLRRNGRILEFCRPQCVNAFLNEHEQEALPAGMAYDDAD